MLRNANERCVCLAAQFAYDNTVLTQGLYEVATNPTDLSAALWRHFTSEFRAVFVVLIIGEHDFLPFTFCLLVGLFPCSYFLAFQHSTSTIHFDLSFFSLRQNFLFFSFLHDQSHTTCTVLFSRNCLFECLDKRGSLMVSLLGDANRHYEHIIRHWSQEKNMHCITGVVNAVSVRWTLIWRLWMTLSHFLSCGPCGGNSEPRTQPHWPVLPVGVTPHFRRLVQFKCWQAAFQNIPPWTTRGRKHSSVTNDWPQERQRLFSRKGKQHRMEPGYKLGQRRATISARSLMFNIFWVRTVREPLYVMQRSLSPPCSNTITP